ncbi:MAG: hypothetical protein Q7S39_04015 [Ignavibacteria bacterium]|nr:hypothetical protein [Ignavibacteria bacterium]
MKDKCYKTRKLILPPTSRGEVELLTPELEEAKLHLKECKECQSFFAQQDELRKFIKDNLPKAKVSASVREEVLKSISKKKEKKFFSFKNKSKYPSRFWWAAAVIIAFVVSIFLLDPFPEETSDTDQYIVTESEKSGYQLTEELINDYIRYRLSEQPAEYATNNPQELNNWFSRRLDFNARFSSIDELQLVGGRLCYLFESRVALAFYQKPDQWVSLFIFKDKQINLSKMKTVKLQDKTVWCGESRGYELTIWKQNDLLYALVADADCVGMAEKLLERI